MAIANIQTTKNSATALASQAIFVEEDLADSSLSELQLLNGGNILYEQLYQQLQIDYEALKLSLIDYKQQANFWKAKHGESVRREEQLKNDVKKLTAELKKAKHKIFGKSSEKKTNKPEVNGNKDTSDTQEDVDKKKRKRGQQSNNNGPARRDYSHLPAVIDEIDLPENEKCCSQCGLLHDKQPGSEESEIIEVVEVKAHVRKVRRAVYKRHASCNCPAQPGIITAPPAPRVFPKTRYGVSVWAKALLEKFCYQRPIDRLLKFLANQGLDLSSGTITGGLKKIVPLLFPIYDAFQQKSLTETHWHADETRWEVYEEVEGKAGSRWYLWIFRSENVVVLKVSPSRSAKTPREYFQDIKEGILSVDRYSAYKAIAKDGILILAFCWAHVRRDFLDHAKSYPDNEVWAFDWVNEIASLYHINNQRIAVPGKSEAFNKLNLELQQAADKMQEKYRTQLADDKLPEDAKKILISLDNHWEGLTVFIECPFVPMDNNQAENGLRPGVLARKAFFGSHAVWSAYLLVMMLSIYQTLSLWDINPHSWIYRYLQACAENAGNPPDHLKSFLPWDMSKQRLKSLQQAIPYEDTS